MANWTVSLDKPPAVEDAGAVVYVTYLSDDDRAIGLVRIPYESDGDLLGALAVECSRLSALDDRRAQIAAVVASSTLKAGPLTLPDISKRQALDAAQFALQAKLRAVDVQQKIAFDPTVADAKAAVEAAQAAADASPAQAQPIGP